MTGEMGVVLTSEVEAGRYICVKTRSPFGWVIRVFTRSLFDHALINLGNGDIAEATVTGVRIDRLDSYRGQPACANTAEPMTGAQRAAVCVKARSFAGMEYGWGTVMLIGLRSMGARSRWLTRMLTDRDALICSQMVCLSSAPQGPDWQCGEMSPEFVEPAGLARRPGVERLMWG